jgi:hypothetical protein
MSESDDDRNEKKKSTLYGFTLVVETMLKIEETTSFFSTREFSF